MKEQVVIASIFGNDLEVYKRVVVDFKPSHYQWIAAKRSDSPYYILDLKKRATSLGFDVTKAGTEVCPPGGDFGDHGYLQPDKEPTSDNLVSSVEAVMMSIEELGMYAGTFKKPDAGQLQRHVWQSPDLIRKIELFWDGWTDDPIGLDENYEGDIGPLNHLAH